MPRWDFFVRFGLFARPRFLEPEVCAAVCAEALSAGAREAEVYRQGDDRVAEELRRTKIAGISSVTAQLLSERLRGVLPEVDAHFTAGLRDLEEPQVLAYRPGDYFHAHRDSSDDGAAPAYLRQRRVSVVLFLNGQAGSPGPVNYTGGSLTFYGLSSEPGWEKVGFHLEGEAGLLVAFRSEIRHAVEPVTTGQRFTVVSWFF